MGICLFIVWLFVYCVKVPSVVLDGYLLFIADYFLVA